jgi:hypothetical protein
MQLRVCLFGIWFFGCSTGGVKLYIAAGCYENLVKYLLMVRAHTAVQKQLLVSMFGI